MIRSVALAAVLATVPGPVTGQNLSSGDSIMIVMTEHADNDATAAIRRFSDDGSRDAIFVSPETKPEVLIAAIYSLYDRRANGKNGVTVIRAVRGLAITPEQFAWSVELLSRTRTSALREIPGVGAARVTAVPAKSLPPFAGRPIR